MAHDAENRDLVEQACVDFEQDLRAYLMAMLRDVHSVDDVFQKTVIRAIEASASVNPVTVRGWLFQIALNEVRETKRKSTRQGRLERAVWESIPTDAHISTKDGFQNAVSEEEKQQIRHALQRLSYEYREVVVRRIQRGQTFATIAKDMNKPLGTVLTWMRRALIELKEMNELRHLSDD